MNATARIAGLLYLLLGVTGAFSLLYVPSQLFAPDDPAATFANITAAPELLRLGIASGLIHKIVFLILPFLLFVLFERSGRIAAGVLIAFVLASVPIYFTAMQNLYAVLPIAEANAPSADAGHDVTRLITRYETGLKFAEIFWGLWLIPFGYLVWVSRAMPRVIGALLIVGGAGYLANFFGPLLAPNVYAGEMLSVFVAMPSAFGELGAALWLTLFGIQNISPEEGAAHFV